jgi:hypothetical protein
MVRKYEIYALSQIYQEEFCWWSDNNEKMELLRINNYWDKKDICMFKNCSFDERHIGLNIERVHVKEYFENTLHIEDMTEEQITIFLTYLQFENY